MSCNAGKLLWLGVLLSFTSIAVAQLPTEFPVIVRTFRTDAIVRGEDVVASSQWPWQVFIELDNGDNQCGGTLISNQWILTAAHCFDGGKQATKIVMGTISRSNKFRRGVIGIPDIVCCHQKYDTVTLDYDICLIKLAQARDQTVNIDWLPLPTAGSELADGTECYITGWGYNERMVLPDILQEAMVKVVGRQQCIAWHKPHNTVVVNNTVCAGHELGGADSCGGDSGGPMVCRNHRGEYILQGVTSYGPSYCGAAKLPGIYTKVSAYIDWIQEKMNNPCLRTEWGPWSGGCSVTCGIGTSSKTRICLNDAGEKIDSFHCNGRSEEQGLCIQKPCPTYNWGEWTEGICSKTCGDAVRTDVRYCTSSNGTRVNSERCTGTSTRITDCSLPDCPAWSEWTEGICSKTCGDAVRTDIRYCTSSNGTRVNPERCTGTSTRITDCSLPDCPAWSEWTEGICSKTCGDAVRTDVRYCTIDNGTRVNPERCTGTSTRITDCSLLDCPAWSEWTEGICSKTCGDAVRTDVRYCTIDKGTRVNPERCTGTSTRITNCSLPDCPVPHFWGPWSSICSVTCGEGVRTRTRECRNSLGLTTNEISRCFPGLNTEFDSCQLPACTGMPWGEWGPWSACQPEAFTSCLGTSYSTRTCGLIWFRGFCSGENQRTRFCVWRACSPQEAALLRQRFPS